MKESEIKIGMTVKYTNPLDKVKGIYEIGTVKRLLWKDSKGKQIYEIESDTMDRFHRPYKCVSQALAEYLMPVEIE